MQLDGTQWMVRHHETLVVCSGIAPPTHHQYISLHLSEGTLPGCSSLSATTPWGGGGGTPAESWGC